MRRYPKQDQSGFTLIEVLVAVVVLALALAAIISAVVQYTGNAVYIRDKTLATWVARNKLAELHLAPTWPDLGKSDGTAEMAGREWPWRIEVDKTPDNNLRRIEVDVDSPDTKGSLAQLVGYLAAKPVSP
jgi:general secretion pathway protein I